MELKVFTLGRFSLLRKENPIRFKRKPPKKPIMLLKALISMGGRGVRKESIADVLWPEVDGDIADRSLATTLHRLRKLIALPAAVKLSNGCLTLDQNLCWVDIWAFERLCGNADAAWDEKGNAVKAVALTEKAIKIYNGPFLLEEYHEPWTVLMRDRLRSKYLRCIGKLGHYLEKSGKLEKAVDCYQRSLETDGLDEESYRRLMACYFRLGRRAKAIAVYDRCKMVLDSIYGLKPSQETEVLRKSIIMSNGYI